MHRSISALLSLAFSVTFLATPHLIPFANDELHGSAWAKDGGNKGGNSGRSNGGRGGGNSHGSNSKNGDFGKNSSSSLKSKTVTFVSSPTLIAAAKDSVTKAQIVLAKASQAFDAALADPQTDTVTLLTLEAAITAAEKSLRQASARAASLGVGN